MGDKAVSEDSFMLKYYHDRHKTEKISDKAVVVFLQGSKFLLDWVVTSKMICPNKFKHCKALKKYISKK